MTTTFASGERLIAGYGRSDQGRVRENNEDNFICDNNLGLYAVIDGMGGKAAGEVAAGIARDIIQKRMAWPTGTPAERLREAITLANNEIFSRGSNNQEWQGMGCVLTVALL
ncbi:MAG: serine/threonine-protein phosphatase, partial [Acidobacteria bacterium]|nr:serine/threonine-protein phosphatase [Acidobacteriota bacterium]